ncbi:hypothetical protein [Acrocarpospora sp. B8E8]|uniref:hypothetical protein n=1 Tax=Acrocarpospora sp. B8E8 TaxID=3153572 RepID=UPI00325DEBC7
MFTAALFVILAAVYMEKGIEWLVITFTLGFIIIAFVGWVLDDLTYDLAYCDDQLPRHLPGRRRASLKAAPRWALEFEKRSSRAMWVTFWLGIGVGALVDTIKDALMG